MDEAIVYMKAQMEKHGDKMKINDAEFDKESGVGIVVTEADMRKLIDDEFEVHSTEIKELEWMFPWKKLVAGIEQRNKWADKKFIMGELEIKKVKVLGAKPDKKTKKPKAAKPAVEEKKQEDAAPAQSGKDILKLIGIDIGSSANKKEHLEAHKKETGGQIRTRFPPEPNGYLHIGHAKAIRFNFTVAEENGGTCYLRFDDTNPCKENHEFIDHIKKNVAWLGYTPAKVTASSDYFQELYEFAIDLIKKDKAFVCFQN